MDLTIKITENDPPCGHKNIEVTDGVRKIKFTVHESELLEKSWINLKDEEIINRVLPAIKGILQGANPPLEFVERSVSDLVTGAPLFPPG